MGQQPQSKESPPVSDGILISCSLRFFFCPDTALHIPSHSFSSLCLSAEGIPPLCSYMACFIFLSLQSPTYHPSNSPRCLPFRLSLFLPDFRSSKSFGFSPSLRDAGSMNSLTSLPCCSSLVIFLIKSVS